MVLRIITKVCKVKSCNHVIKTLSNTIYSLSINERERNMNTEKLNLCYLFTAKCNGLNFLLTPFFYEDDKPAVLLCSGFRERDLKTLHLHGIPIQNPRKFQSLVFTKQSSPRRFFNLINPAHLHTMNSDRIFDL